MDIQCGFAPVNAAGAFSEYQDATAWPKFLICRTRAKEKAVVLSSYKSMIDNDGIKESCCFFII